MKRRSLLALFATLGASCAYDPPLQQASFHLAFAGVQRDATQPFTVTTPQGWTVTFTAAQLSVGPLYFHNRQAGSGTDEDDGRVVAQVLAQFTIDALDPNTGSVENAGSGITETVRTAEVRLVEANDGPIADSAGAGLAVAHVAGVAQNNAVAIAFEGSLVLSNSAAASGYESWLQHRVAHIPTTFTPVEGGTLTVRVDPTHWLDDVSFDAMAGTQPDFTSRNVTTQWIGRLGASTGVFDFQWTAPVAH